jgi:Flp pilus assembly protein TadB
VLSDHERKTLREVERQLMIEDPKFTRAFETRQTAMSRHPLWLAANIAVVVTALLAALMLAAGSLAGALAFAFTTPVIWVTWRHIARTDRRAP